MEHRSVDGNTDGVCTTRTDHLWTLQELNILQELPTPIVVLLHETNRLTSDQYGFYSNNPCWTYLADYCGEPSD